MMFKPFFLSLIFLPTLFVVANDTQMSIVELKAQLAQKILAFSAFSREVEAQEELMDSMIDKAINVMAKYLVTLKTEEEKKDFFDEISAFEKRLNQVLVTGKFKGYLVEEIFGTPGTDTRVTARVKSLLIRWLVEKDVLRNLLLQCEEKLQEIADLEIELRDREKLIAQN